MTWVLAADVSLIGAIAAFTTTVGVAMSILSHITGRNDAAEHAAAETHVQLLEARAEAERLSAELHKLKMERDD